MSRVRIEYHNGSPSIDIDLDRVMQYEVVKGKTPEQPDQIRHTNNGQRKCGYEYLASSMIHEHPLVVGNEHGEFERLISMRAVRCITNLTQETK